MTDDKLKAVEAGAKRLLEAIADLRKANVACPTCANPRESGTVRRASMDLTRALADLRKPI
jgi:hypothetical protein